MKKFQLQMCIKEKTRMIIVLMLIATVSMVFGTISNVYKTNFSNQTHNKAIPKVATTWNGMILINNNWSTWKANFPQIMSGMGIEVDPFIIKDLIIDGMGGLYGIYIMNGNNTTYFRIENCTISNCSNKGIATANSYNGIIQNNTIFNCDYGINIYAVGNNTNMLITNNIIYNHTNIGIYIDDANNNTLINNSVSFNANYGIQISSADIITIQNNSINNSSLYGLYVANSNQVLITNNTVFNNTQHGIYTFNSDNFTISNNSALFNKMNGIYIHTSSETNYVHHNRVFNNSYSGINIYYSNNSHNFNNSIYNNGQNGLSFDHSDDNQVLGNLIENNMNEGIRMNVARNNLVDNNTIRLNGQNGIYILEPTSTNITLTNNLLQENSNTNINILNSEIINIVNNTLLGGSKTSSASILAKGVINVNFTLNIINNSKGFGIKLDTLKNVIHIENNTILNSASQGIYLLHTNDTLIENNEIQKNYIGIYFSNGSSNIIRFNKMNENSYGITIDSSKHNLIYNNSLKYNTIQAYGDYYGTNNSFYDNNIYDPITNWTANITMIFVGMDIHFSSTIIADEPFSINWDFADGSFSTQHDPIHKFSNSGNYTVILSVIDHDGESVNFSSTIIVLPLPFNTLTGSTNGTSSETTSDTTTTTDFDIWEFLNEAWVRYLLIIIGIAIAIYLCIKISRGQS